MSEETTAKTTVAVGDLVPQPHGGALRNGGTNKGGPGRPTKAFKAFAADMAQSVELQDALKTAALAGDVSAIKLLIQYAEGLPTRVIRLEGMRDAQRAFDLIQRVLHEVLPADDAQRIVAVITNRLTKEE